MKKSVQSFVYHLAGFRLLSDFPLSGLVPWDDRIATPDQIVITRSEMPVSLEGAVREFPGGTCNESEVLLNIPGMGRFLIQEGREIRVGLADGASVNDIQPYLLGTAFGLLCHQRGIVPLHASSIDVEGGCVAFVGDSGAGKSTLIAALAARGFPVITDDVCFLQFDKDGKLDAWPGIGRIRLWEEALYALRLEGPGVTRETSGYNKYLVPMPQPSNPYASRRLQKIYQLQATADGEVPNIARVQGATAVEILLRNIYRIEYAEYMGRKAAIFEFCTRMARNAQVSYFSRPMGFDLLQSGVDLLIKDIGKS